MSNILTNNINPRSGNTIAIGGVNDIVSIAGSITYDDVTNVDAVGIITARGGLNVGPLTGIAFTVSSAGAVFASSNIRVGGNAIGGSKNGSVILSNSGFLAANDNAAVPLWRGYTTGNITPTSEIEANGDSYFLGNVGIGTDATPFGKLQVHAGDEANFSFSTGGGESSLEILNDAGSANVPLNVRASVYKIKIQGNEKVRISSAGNVGIGNTICETILDLRTGDVGSQNAITMGYGRSSNPTDAIHKISWASDALIIQADTAATIASDIIFKNDGSETMRIDSAGQVILNNSASSGDATILRLTGGTSGSSVIEMGDTADTDIGQIAYYHGTANAMGFRVNASERMRIDSTGRVLIGATTTGSTAGNAPLQVVSSSSAWGINLRCRSDDDYAYFAFTSNDSDESLANIFARRNSANTGDLVFETNGGNASATTRMTITSTGNIKIPGTTGSVLTINEASPSGNFLQEISYDSAGRGCLYLENFAYYGSAPALVVNDQDSNNARTMEDVQFKRAGSLVGYIRIDPGSVTYSTSSSDIRTKKNFEDWTEDNLSKFKTLSPKLFNWIEEDDGSEKTKGFIAQDNLEKFPEAYPLTVSTDRYAFNPSGMVAYMMKALQEAALKIETLEQRLTDAGL